MRDDLEWLKEFWPFFLFLSGIAGSVVKIYYDHLKIKEKQAEDVERNKSYRDTTDATIKQINVSKEERQKEIENKFRDYERNAALEIKLARSEAQKELLEYKQENSKRLDEQSKLIHQLLLDTKEIGVTVTHISTMLREIKSSQKDNAQFREDFYKGQIKHR